VNIVGIIPARMASTRFPGKPLAKICGIPMIGHVYFRSKMCKSLSNVYIATCDEAISSYAESIGGKSIMTSVYHERASDRAAEAMLKIEEETGEKIDFIVMIQGDEPMLYPEMIEKSIEPMLSDPALQVINLMAPLKSIEEHNDPHEVKVVVDLQNYALYFSREPIPSLKKGSGGAPVYKQVPIIPFRRDFLLKFNALAQATLEIAESVDMLRVLEHGYKVKMVPVDFGTYSVDTPEDLKKVEGLMKNDPLVGSYRDIGGKG